MTKEDFWQHSTQFDCKVTKEKHNGEIVAIDKPNESLRENIIRMKASSLFASAVLGAAGTGVNEEKAKRLINLSLKNPKYMEISEKNKLTQRIQNQLDKHAMNKLKLLNEAIEHNFKEGQNAKQYQEQN